MKKNIILFLVFSLLSSCKDESIERPSYRVERGTIEQKVALNGRTESSQQSVISAPFDISVKSLKTSIGQVVKAGNTLAELDTTTLMDKYRDEKTRIIQIETRITNGQIRVKNLQKEFGRLERLVVAGAASLVEKEQKNSEIQISINDVNAILKEKENLEENLKIIEQQINLLEMKAPFDGIVTYVWETQDKFTSGMSVKKGDVLFKLSSQGKMQVKTTCSENEVNYFTKGQKVKILFPNLSNQSVIGSIVQVDHSATVDKESGIAHFRISVEFDPTGDVKPGMEAIIEHVVDSRKGVLKIPRPALFQGQNGYEVHGLRENKIIKKKVVIGLIGDEDVEIKEGLSDGEWVMMDHE